MKYLFYLFIVVGLVLFSFAAQQYFSSRNLLQNGIRTNARVINMITVSDPDGDTYRPIFEYLDQNKTKRVFESSMSSNPPAYAIGDLIEIVYDPKDQKNVSVVSFVGLYLLSLILFVSGLSFLMVGIVFRMKLKNKQNEISSEYQK